MPLYTSELRDGLSRVPDRIEVQLQERSGVHDYARGVALELMSGRALAGKHNA